MKSSWLEEEEEDYADDVWMDVDDEDKEEDNWLGGGGWTFGCGVVAKHLHQAYRLVSHFLA